MIERRRRRRLQLRNGRRVRLHDGTDEARLALALESFASRRHLVEKSAQGEDVRARVHFLGFELLGCHVLKRPDDGALGGERLRRGGKGGERGSG